MRARQFKRRDEGYPPARLQAIRKGLRTRLTLELMTQTIYKSQITGEQNNVNCQLITAMGNEMGHIVRRTRPLEACSVVPAKA